MLKKCYACQGNVSAAADSCPHCGHPMATPTARSERTITTQATGKVAKLHQLLAGIMIIAGVAAAANGHGVGGLVIVISLVWLIAARLYAWWHYG